MLKEYASPNSPNPEGWLHTSQHLYSIILQQMEYSPSSRLMWVFSFGWPIFVRSIYSRMDDPICQLLHDRFSHRAYRWFGTSQQKMLAFYPQNSIQKNGEVSKFFISSVAVTAMRFPTRTWKRPVWTRLVPVVACHGTRHCDLQGTKAMELQAGKIIELMWVKPWKISPTHDWEW